MLTVPEIKELGAFGLICLGFIGTGIVVYKMILPKLFTFLENQHKVIDKVVNAFEREQVHLRESFSNELRDQRDSFKTSLSEVVDRLLKDFKAELTNHRDQTHEKLNQFQASISQQDERVIKALSDFQEQMNKRDEVVTKTLNKVLEHLDEK